MAITPFLTSFFIILREGFEILLITTLVFTYINKWNNSLCEKGHKEDTKAKRYVWIGIINAVLGSIIIALGFTYIKTLTHAHEEIFEAVTMLIAAGFLTYVAIWCHTASQHVKGTIDKAITHGASLALGLTVFVAIVREGFEIVLFYAALFASPIAETGPIWLGGVFGLIVLFVIYGIMNKASKQIPTRLFFTVSKYFLAVLAIYFAYSGMHEIMELVEHYG